MTDFAHVNRSCIAAELGMLTTLLDADGINETGLQAAYRWVTHPRQVLEANGQLYDMREQVLARVIDGLARETGMPPEYWTDRPMLPDDLGGLG